MIENWVEARPVNESDMSSNIIFLSNVAVGSNFLEKTLPAKFDPVVIPGSPSLPYGGVVK